jgi:arylsulfatase A-like enzyme
VRDEVALNIDVAPTLLAAAGLPVPGEMQGRDLMPLIRGEVEAWREDFLFEHLFQHARIPRSDGVVAGRYKYLRYIDQEPVYEQLFDLKTDPHETLNVAGDPDHGEVLRRMRDRYGQLVAEAGGSPEEATAAAGPPAGR